ncbi:MAG TPA: sterol desaturase family protein [Micropepsaceae bacterium]|jgi:sterol desaturase/sphingolipid hydroxylase (fatty acid hydroxylase superfamily)|nr:sterol desaturase family protein [Micropepsaceae bacterium]
MQISNLTLPHRSSYVLLVFLVLIAVEFLWYRWRRTQGYDLKESAASLVIAVGRRLTRMGSSVLLLPVFLWVYDHRLFTIPINNVGSVLGLFLIVEFFYYWFHRFSHTVRWMWASHSVHHSSTKMNLSAAYRVGFTDLFSGDWIFFLMPMWLGFNPVAVLAALGANLTYQILLHTEVIGSLGPLEWIFNTPAHHRVHHAKNESCLDKNFGGILIVYDRLFGTFAKAPENEPLQYGLAQKSPSVNPLRIAFGEWLSMFADLWRARTPANAWRAVFGRP